MFFKTFFIVEHQRHDVKPAVNQKCFKSQQKGQSCGFLNFLGPPLKSTACAVPREIKVEETMQEHIDDRAKFTNFYHAASYANVVIYLASFLLAVLMVKVSRSGGFMLSRVGVASSL